MAQSSGTNLLRDELSWKSYFVAAGIPDDESSHYATIFTSNRITDRTIHTLNDDHLKGLGISVLGDRLAILDSIQSHSTVPDSTLPAPTQVSSIFKPPAASIKLPNIISDMTHPQFRKFMVDWHVYKRMTGLPDSQIPIHLYTACEDSVQHSLINSHPNFLDMREEVMLSHIEAVVTKSSNPTVHRMTFGNLLQGENESIKEYVVRLRTQAIDCEFSCPDCNSDISRMLIKDQFIRGIRNETLQTELLAKGTQFKTIDDAVKHSEAFESALRDQSQLSSSSEAHAARATQYRRNKKHGKWFHSSKPPSTCQGCGSTTHGVEKTPPRNTHCPAWGKQCQSCQRFNHQANVCLHRPSEANCIEGSSAEDTPSLIAHVQYSSQSDCYSASDSLEEIHALLTPRLPNSSSSSILIFPDSGANICLAGTKHLSHMGITTAQLHPCKKIVKAVGGSTLTCNGWIHVLFEVDGHKTMQPVYFCDRIDRVYLSKQGCIEMNILSSTYPHPMPPAAAAVHTLQTPSYTQPPARPSALPFEPTPENVPKLEQYIRDQFADSAFRNTPPFAALSGPPAKIHLKEGAVPFARHCPIPVPHHWKADVKAGIDQDIERGIIAPVPVGTPVMWCSPMVVVSKADGRPRRTVDYQKLNAQCHRETHHTSSPFHLASQIPPGTKKSVIDAVDGFHSVELDPESRPLTTFITEWGRFWYLRMPQGFVAAGDAYTRRYDDIISHVERKLKIVDDTLLYDETIEGHFFHVWDYLTLCALNGITVNQSKFVFCQDVVDFAGLTITPTGVVPSEKLLSAITNFPRPNDLSSARSWFGLVNQVAWAYSVSPVMQPFRDLIKPHQKFYWDEHLDKLFVESKAAIVDLVKLGVESFDISRRICAQPDWSKEGIGYLLLQKHCSCSDKSPVCCTGGWKLIFAGSRFTKPAERNYSPTEGEALALAWSLRHSRMFTLGCPDLFVATDHKPLLGIFNDRDLGSIENPRVLSLKEYTLAWKFDIVHCPGKWTRGPDALSRYPANLSAIAEVPDSSDIAQVNSLIEISQVSYVHAMNQINILTADDIANAVSADPEYQDLVALIQKGFPTHRKQVEPAHLREYWNVRERLSIFNGTALLDQRLVIPRSLRKVVLSNLHSAHQGVSSMRSRANSCVYWPGLDAALQAYRDTCRTCMENSPSQSAEQLILTPSPSYPFQQICSDYFQLGSHTYLSIVDRFTAWICLYSFRPHQATHVKLQDIFRDLFVAYGVSEELSTDGGPQFTSAGFQQFLQLWCVKHRLSSAEYPQSNGRAEVAVKSAKRMIRDNLSPDGGLNNNKVAQALLQYRNTPLPDIGLSPAQMLLHRQLRDSVPSHPDHYQLHKDWVVTAEERENASSKRTHLIVEQYNKKRTDLPPLPVGTDVVIQGPNKKWDRSGRIVEALPFRQYRIRMFHSGRVLLRNRKYIRKCTAIFPQRITVDTPIVPFIPENPIQQQAEESQVEPESADAPVESECTEAPVEPESVDTTVAERNPVEAPIVTSKLPRALRNLLPHNNPGLQE